MDKDKKAPPCPEPEVTLKDIRDLLVKILAHLSALSDAKV